MAEEIFRFMSDDEYKKFLEEDRKQQLLKSLSTTASSQKFSLTKLKKPLEDEEDDFKPIIPEKINKKVEEHSKLYGDNDHSNGVLEEERWQRMVEDFEIMLDPFSEISNKEQFSYKDTTKDDEDYYDKRFSKEYSLLHALLGQVEKDSKAVNNKIKELVSSKKPGIGKYSVVDLWNTANSMHTTKLQTIKEIANIKKLASELKLKEMKNLPPENTSVEGVASDYYNTILKGGRKSFINAMGADGAETHLDDNDEGYISSNTPIVTNISNMNIKRSGYEEEGTEYTTSYIETENDEIQVYVQRFDDGEMEFCALDKDGREVRDYPLPDQSLISTLNIRPDSNYTFDEYGRKYKIIDFGNAFEEVDVQIDDDEDY